MIDDEARTTARSGMRERLAPLIVYGNIIPFSPSVARFFEHCANYLRNTTR
jgi:hypothetical protein